MLKTGSTSWVANIFWLRNQNGEADNVKRQCVHVCNDNINKIIADINKFKTLVDSFFCGFIFGLLSCAWNRFCCCAAALALCAQIVNGILHACGATATEQKMQAAILGFHCHRGQNERLKARTCQPGWAAFFGCARECEYVTRVLGHILFL